MDNDATILLIKKVQLNSDSDALDTLIQNHKNLIFHLILKYNTRNSYYIEDISQEAYIALIDAVRTYRGSNNCKFTTFAYFVIRNKILNFILKQKLIDKHYLSNSELNTISLPQISPNNLKPFIFGHINKTLTSLESLIIKWKFGLDNESSYSSEEIAKISSLSSRRVNQIIQISLQKLRISIEDESELNNKNLFLGET